MLSVCAWDSLVVLAVFHILLHMLDQTQTVVFYVYIFCAAVHNQSGNRVCVSFTSYNYKNMKRFSSRPSSAKKKKTNRRIIPAYKDSLIVQVEHSIKMLMN